MDPNPHASPYPEFPNGVGPPKVEDKVKVESISIVNGSARDRVVSTPYKEKFLALRQKYESVNSVHEEYVRDLGMANARMKRLQAENDLLLDAVGLLMAIDQQQLQVTHQIQQQLAQAQQLASQTAHPHSRSHSYTSTRHREISSPNRAHPYAHGRRERSPYAQTNGSGYEPGYHNGNGNGNGAYHRELDREREMSPEPYPHERHAVEGGYRR